MYNQKSFLEQPDQTTRQYLQLLGFMSDTYWGNIVNVLYVNLFYLPKTQITKRSLDGLKINQYLRLGNRLERFFAFIIDQSDQYELVEHNIQIISDKVTLGELDFIIKDTLTNAIIHVELAAKLYLYDPNIDDEPKRWIGPNRKDVLQHKLIKLKEHQLPLLYHQTTRALLKQLGLDANEITQKICYKVRQFLPWKMENLPPMTDQNNIKGYYVNKAQFDDRYFQLYQYFMPEKQDWIVDPKYGEVWFTYDEIKAKIAIMHKLNQSPLLWLKKADLIYETLFVTFW